MTNAAREIRLAGMLAKARIAGESRIVIGKPMYHKQLDFGKDRIGHIIKEHGVLDLSKLEQGIFREDAIQTTITAWGRAAKLGLKPISTNRADYYVIPLENAGFSGGTIGETGTQLNFVTIITKPSSSEIITSFPTTQSGPIKLREFINDCLYGELKK
jgi:hypothetical protein